MVGRISQGSYDVAVDDVSAITAVAATEAMAPSTEVEAFWARAKVELVRWNRLYPYQLVVVRAVAGPNGGDPSYQLEPGWSFTFPVPPEALTQQLLPAMPVSATLGGIAEEHNGIPFRIITLRGTLGVLGRRGRAPQQEGFNIAETIAGGTVAQLRRAQGDFGATIASAAGVAVENPNVHKAAEFEDNTNPIGKSTGYYQFLRLQAFYEAYAALKKKREGRNLHLALCIWKEQSVYLVTPLGGDFSKDASSPLEYRYNLPFKAWRRITLDQGAASSVFKTLPIRRNPNALARLLNTMQNARLTLQSLSKAAAAVVGDIDRLVFEPLREAVLFAKDALGLGLTLAELPDSIVASLQDSWVALQGEASSISDFANTRNDGVKGQLLLGQDAANETKDMVTPRAARARQRVMQVHPAAKAFRKPKEAFRAMAATDVGKLKPSAAVAAAVKKERERIKNLRRRDFEQRRDQLERAATMLAFALGAGHPTVAATYDINVTAVKETPTESDWDALYALNESITAMDALAATGDNEPTAREDAVEVMAGLARRSGIAFQVPRSKYAVPFPYGSTLEDVARIYLRDPERWPEIAALNGLRSPYVDEVGFDMPLLVNGADNQVVVAKTDNLYVGQMVYIWSRGARRVRRRVQALRVVNDSIVVTVDGDTDMGAYRTKDQALLSAFLPDTVNSQSLIYIPSDREPADDDFITKSIPGVNEFDPMVAVGGVDLLLDSNNDLVITPDGDVRLAVGLTNLVQNVRVALSVRRGDLMGHPEFGLPLEVGMSTADFDAHEVLQAVRRMLQSDPSIANVAAVQVTKNNGVASIRASIQAYGTEQPVPVSFDVQRDA